MTKRSMHQEVLTNLKGSPITVYLVNGKAITGNLLDFDDEALKLSGRNQGDPPSIVNRDQITTYHAGSPPKVKKGKNAPD